ncbi:hypothetical protein [Lysobacter gummosus]|uniref:hypothetical protein n=1 Tax=Lysobacter gummosus TaxID=262324 RepID=UPI003627BEFC
MRTPTYRHSRERGNPATSNVLARKALDSRVRGNDEQKAAAKQKQDQTPKASAMERRVTFFVQSDKVPRDFLRSKVTKENALTVSSQKPRVRCRRRQVPHWASCPRWHPAHVHVRRPPGVLRSRELLAAPGHS